MANRKVEVHTVVRTEYLDISWENGGDSEELVHYRLEIVRSGRGFFFRCFTQRETEFVKFDARGQSARALHVHQWVETDRWDRHTPWSTEEDCLESARHFCSAQASGHDI